MDKKSIACEFVVAMIQRGYFDNIETNQDRITAIVDTYEETLSQIESRQVEKLKKSREAARKIVGD